MKSAGGITEEMSEMKKSLLTTVATAALIAATGFASAESAKDHGMSASPAAKSDSGPASRNEPMKQGSDNRSPQKKGRAETNGAASTKTSSEPRADSRANTKANGKVDNKANAEKSKPSTTGQGDQKSGPSRSTAEKSLPSKEPGKADTKANADKTKPSTTGQGEQKSGASRSTAEEKSSPSKANEPPNRSSTDTRSGAGTRSGAENRSGDEVRSNSAATNERGGGNAGVNLSSEQKTKIRTTVLQSSSAPKVSRSSINFNISVGTVVPRDRVHYVAVSPALVEIHPEWRGHYYFVVDDEIIIVDAGGRIVAIVDV